MILLGFFVAFLLVMYIITNHQKNSLLTHKRFTRGDILRVFSKGKSNMPTYEYIFYLKGSPILGYRRIPYGIIRDSLIHKAFPVMYDTTANYNSSLAPPSEMLITPGEFQKYNLTFPDSLMWVLRYNIK